MKYLLALVSLSILAACGKTEIGGFADYTARFEAEAHNRGQNVNLGDIKIVFGEVGSNPNGSVMALCHPGLIEKTITVDKKEWDGSSESDRESMLFHEMGHCLLGRAHKNEESNLGEPVSLMYYATVRGDIYEQNKKAYLDELFTRQ